MFEYLIVRLSVLLTFGVGTLLVVLYPMLKKESKIFAWISLLAGAFIMIIVLYFLVDPLMSKQIF
ncbi:hypothetical protein D7Z54_26510 [Salibacterium salarium]|uniref:Uncharacterized protein n=1 Tax=Salibacterium salarium TaxID=284579 RepID=A0A428MW89_9BACI|nr:hypothetical protein [Salibacterium salarium]RSL30392.1 hypothetical protein D7Z54_26510 [Salibacterium salarium]